MTEPAEPGTMTSHRWRPRPGLSLALRVVAGSAPGAVALGCSLLAARLLPPPAGTGARIAWWVLLTACSLAVMAAVHRVARRLLPLAALLRLSLVFPDAAPDRYKMARKVGRPKDLAALVEQAREAGREGGEMLGPQTVLELIAALSVHDRATRGHSERVRIFTDLIADELKLPAGDRDRLRWAALLHDVGKLVVPATLLKKPSAPTTAEWALLKQHPQQGRRIISPIATWLGPWALAVDHHHERYNGAGYPCGLRGQEISLGGRIVAVADAYETMTAARPYKRPISPGAARKELVACSGSHFDPVVVRAFLGISLGRLWRTVGISAWISQVPLLPQLSSGLGAVGAQAVPLAARGAVGLALVTGAAVAAPSPSAAASGAATQQVAASVTGPAAAPPPPSTGHAAAHPAPGKPQPPKPGPPKPAPPKPAPSPKGAPDPAPPKHTPAGSTPKATPTPARTPTPSPATAAGAGTAGTTHPAPSPPRATPSHPAKPTG